MWINLLRKCDFILNYDKIQLLKTINAKKCIVHVYFEALAFFTDKVAIY